MFIYSVQQHSGRNPTLFSRKGLLPVKTMRITVQMGKKHQQQIVNHANILGFHTVTHNFEGVRKPIDLKCNSAGNNSWKAHIQYSGGKLARHWGNDGNAPRLW